MIRYVYVLTASLILISCLTASSTPVKAQGRCPVDPSDNCLRFVGVFRRGYLSDEDLGEITPGETIVASFANYLSTVNDNTAGQGNVRIRVWSRNETVAARYSDDSAPAFAVANKVTFKMAPAPGQSADETFNVIGARPNADDVNDDTGILIAVIYDIFNYFEVPSFIINVITNSISVGGVTIKGIGGSSGTVIVDAPFSLNPLSGLDINLKPDINYTQADIANQGNQSGVQANFIYTLTGTDLSQDFYIVPEVIVEYRITTTQGEDINSFFVESRPVVHAFPVQQPWKSYLPVIEREVTLFENN